MSNSYVTITAQQVYSPFLFGQDSRCFAKPWPQENIISPEGCSGMSQGSAPETDRGSPLLRFLSSAAGFWKGKSGRLSWPLSIALVAITVAQLAIQYLLNYWNRDFFNALERRDGALLWSQALIFIPLACSNIALAVASVWGQYDHAAQMAAMAHYPSHHLLVVEGSLPTARVRER